eukprot:6398325-Amphidinium_carterae.2
MLKKVLDEETATDWDTFDTALGSCINAKNNLVLQCGRSPYMAAFGRAPRVPSQLLDSRNSLTTLSIEESLRKSERMRIEAMHSFLHADQETSIRAALNRKPVHLQDWSFAPGDHVAYYRHRAVTRGAGKSLRPRWLTGTLVCYDPGQRKDKAATLRGEGRNAWIHTGGRLVMISLEQLRPASGYESWVPTEDDWRAIDRMRKRPATIPLADEAEDLPHLEEQEMAGAEIEFAPTDMQVMNDEFAPTDTQVMNDEFAPTDTQVMDDEFVPTNMQVMDNEFPPAATEVPIEIAYERYIGDITSQIIPGTPAPLPSMAARAPSQHAQSSVSERPSQQRRSADAGLESTHAPPTKLPRRQSDASAVLYNHLCLGHVLANDSEDDLGLLRTMHIDRDWMDELSHDDDGNTSVT